MLESSLNMTLANTAYFCFCQFYTYFIVPKSSKLMNNITRISYSLSHKIYWVYIVSSQVPELSEQRSISNILPRPTLSWAHWILTLLLISHLTMTNSFVLLQVFKIYIAKNKVDNISFSLHVIWNVIFKSYKLHLYLYYVMKS